MKKLRLVKPWQLEAVCQRLGDDRVCMGTAHVIPIPCCGPQSAAVFNSEDGLCRCAEISAQIHTSAPAVDVIFSAGRTSGPRSL